jgi:hypothetical protein
MKLIILILANDTNEYLKMQMLWKVYMNKFPYIKSFFIKYKSDLQENIVLCDDTIYIKGLESLIPGCLDKTIQSIEFLLKNNEFDFIFRTNMSSVVDLNKLYNLLNDKIECAGVIGFCNCKRFVSGAGILMNKNTCKMLINNKHTLNYTIMDDVSLGDFFTSNNINITALTRFEAYNYEDNINLITKDSISDYYHFRCKSDNNLKTIELMQRVIQLIY